MIDENANFDMLVSLIKEFYSKMGFDQIRIRPAYFPYTEPSLEFEVFFNGKWMELGGAGIFRPEVDNRQQRMNHIIDSFGLPGFVRESRMGRKIFPDP